MHPAGSVPRILCQGWGVAELPKCARAARVPGITKIRTARRGCRMRQAKASAAGRRMRLKRFLLTSSEAGNEAKAMRKIRRRQPKQTGRRRQRDVLCDVMLSARECETWLTLDELAKLTHYPPASISAQLRHLRKPQFGGFVVRKRQRTTGKVLRGEDFGTVWEYQLRRVAHRPIAGRASLPPLPPPQLPPAILRTGRQRGSS